MFASAMPAAISPYSIAAEPNPGPLSPADRLCPDCGKRGWQRLFFGLTVQESHNIHRVSARSLTIPSLPTPPQWGGTCANSETLAASQGFAF